MTKKSWIPDPPPLNNGENFDLKFGMTKKSWVPDPPPPLPPLPAETESRALNKGKKF